MGGAPGEDGEGAGGLRVPAARPPGAPSAPRLDAFRKAVYALGDLTINTGFAALTLLYASYFLTQVAGLRPALAGLVPLIGRFVDAVTDPLMGRISDRTRLPGGRRRPYFLLGAIPYGLGFAALWVDVPFPGELARFVYYAGAYCLFSLAMTVLSVPYLAIQPEMALDYDERTSLNTWRTVGSLVGVILAVALRPVAELFGGGSTGFAAAGVAFGSVLALPWIAVYRVTFERPELRQAGTPDPGFAEGLRLALAHHAFSRLTALYIHGRIAMDIAGALLILYATWWLGRSRDFEWLMLVFLLSVIGALPIWLHVARGREKSRIFAIGCAGWAVFGGALAALEPGCPRWVAFALIPLVGVGYAVVDLMPWSMLGEVIDEDELRTGVRREGLYHGVFTFVRKIAGALGVALAMGVLDLAGFERGGEQPESARQAIRLLTAFGPTVFLLAAIWLARDYPLTRARHAEIVRELERRRGRAGSGGPAP